MKKRILCVILSLAAVLSLFGFNATEAWFSAGKNKSMELTSGKLSFTATDNLAFNISGEYLPGDTIELTSGTEGLTIKNSSTIDTELRIKIDCEYENEDGTTEKCNWVEFSLPDTETNWKAVTGEDGITYLYYCPDGDASADTPDYRIDAPKSEQTINLNSNLIVSGDVPIGMTDKSMSFTVTLQAKQADFMEWSDFTSASETETTETTTA